MFRHNVLESLLISCNKKGRLYNELNVCYYLIKIYMFDTEMMLIFKLLVQNKKIYTVALTHSVSQHYIHTGKKKQGSRTNAIERSSDATLRLLFGSVLTTEKII